MSGVPSWVPAALASAYDPTSQVFGRTDGNTARFRAALSDAAAGRGTAEQVVIGDSSSDGYDGTEIDAGHAWPMVYRQAAKNLGVPTAGTGWVRAADATGHDSRWTFDSNWNDVLLFQYAVTSGAVATYDEPMPGTVVSLLYSTYAGGSFTVSVDGAQSGPGFASVTTPAAVSYQTLTLSGLPMGQHTVTVTTQATALVSVVAASVSTGQPGLVIDNVAQGGAKASGTGVQSWSQLTNASSIGGAYANPTRYATAPSAVWIDLGGNDINAGVSPATVTSAIRTIAAQFPDSDVFLMLEYQPNEISTSAWTAFAKALYQTAADLGVPLFDEWARLGSYSTYFSNGYAGDALAHLNAVGYTELGRWVGDEALQSMRDRVVKAPQPDLVRKVGPSPWISAR